MKVVWSTNPWQPTSTTPCFTFYPLIVFFSCRRASSWTLHNALSSITSHFYFSERALTFRVSMGATYIMFHTFFGVESILSWLVAWRGTIESTQPWEAKPLLCGNQEGKTSELGCWFWKVTKANFINTIILKHPNKPKQIWAVFFWMGLPLGFFLRWISETTPTGLGKVSSGVSG